MVSMERNACEPFPGLQSSFVCFPPREARAFNVSASPQPLPISLEKSGAISSRRPDAEFVRSSSRVKLRRRLANFVLRIIAVKRRGYQHWPVLPSSMSSALHEGLTGILGSGHCGIMDAQLSNGNANGTERRRRVAASHSPEDIWISHQRHPIRAKLLLTHVAAVKARS